MNMERGDEGGYIGRRYWIIGISLIVICLILVYSLPSAIMSTMQDPFNMTYAPTTVYPTGGPTTKAPTKSPTKAPTKTPTKAPTTAPTTAAPTPS